MDCPANEQLHQYVENELDEAEAAEVRGHLESCASCSHRELEVRQALGTALSGPEAASTQELTPSVAEPQPLAHGAVVGRYTILDRIGSGGMAIVYSAYDPKLDRRVALKFLTTHPQRRSETIRKRFLREAQAMAHLSHPNVVSVHDVGTLGEDVYIAMEYVDGKDLRRWLKDAPRSWREILDTLVAAGRGLAAAHHAGLVHRDVKPSNILVGNDGRIRVMDFGLVRNVERFEIPSDPGLKVERDSALEASLTKTGAIMGTPQYMPPEQRRGGDVDARADQFAFCVTLYKSLFAQVPYDKNQQARLALGREAAPAEPPASRPVPAWLKRAIYRGLSRKPEDRYPSMDALLAALSHGGARRLRRGIAVGAGVTLAFVFIVGFPAWRYQRGRVCAGVEERLRGVWDEPRRGAVTAAFLATGRPYAESAAQRAEGALDAYATSWVKARTEACEATLVRAEASDAVLVRRAGCLERRLRELSTLGTLLASADARTVDSAVGLVDDLPRLEGCGAKAAVRASPPGSLDPDPLSARLAHARMLMRAGHAPDLEGTLPALVADSRRSGDAAALGQALRLEGELDAQSGRLAEAGDNLREAEWASEAASDTESAAEAASSLVTVSAQTDDTALAHLWASQARALIRAAGADERLESDVDLREAAVFRAQGLFEAAEGLAHQAYDLRLRRFGAASPQVADALIQLSEIATRRDRPAMALEQASTAARIFSEVLGSDHPDTQHARALERALQPSAAAQP